MKIAQSSDKIERELYKKKAENIFFSKYAEPLQKTLAETNPIRQQKQYDTVIRSIAADDSVDPITKQYMLDMAMKSGVETEANRNVSELYQNQNNALQMQRMKENELKEESSKNLQKSIFDIRNEANDVNKVEVTIEPEETKNIYHPPQGGVPDGMSEDGIKMLRQKQKQFPEGSKEWKVYEKSIKNYEKALGNTKKKADGWTETIEKPAKNVEINFGSGSLSRVVKANKLRDIAKKQYEMGNYREANYLSEQADKMEESVLPTFYKDLLMSKKMPKREKLIEALKNIGAKDAEKILPKAQYEKLKEANLAMKNYKPLKFNTGNIGMKESGKVIDSIEKYWMPAIGNTPDERKERMQELRTKQQLLPSLLQKWIVETKKVPSGAVYTMKAGDMLDFTKWLFKSKALEE